MRAVPDKSVDLIVTDPPYGISYASARIKDKSKRLGGILNDDRPFIDFIPDAIRILKPSGAMYIFTRWDVQQTFIDAVRNTGHEVKSVCIWDKGTHGMGDLKASYGNRYESILFIPGSRFEFPGRRPQDIITCSKVPPKALMHPNEKPVALIEKLICDASMPGAVVVDPFMGNGTTAVACMRTGRSFVGFELDERYHAIALSRIADESNAMRGDVD